MKPKTWILMCILVLILISLASAYLVMKVNGKKTLSFGTVNNVLYKSKIYPVEITALGFLPPELEISEGDSVTWKNKDSNTHTIVLTSLNITKPVRLLRNESYTYTFNKEGIYNYSCSRQPYKTGKIIVRKYLF